MSEWLNRPIFFAGHRKSGTTLLLNLFDCHPQLCVFPSDSGFFYAWYPRYAAADKSDEERIDRLVDVMFANLRRDLEKLETADGGPDFDELERRFRERMTGRTVTPASILREAIGAYHSITESSAPPPRGWVEKTTSTEIYASEVMDWYPKAKIVHLVRDPRDNFGSLKSGWTRRYREHNDTVERLLQSMLDRGGLGFRLASLNAERFGPKHYRVIRYEDLVQTPEPVLGDLCDFLEIDFDPVLLRPSLCGLPWRGNNFDGLTFDGPSAINVGRWRERINEHEACVIEFYFSELMERWGYAPAFTPAEQADAAREHYKWHNFVQQYSVFSGADTFQPT